MLQIKRIEEIAQDLINRKVKIFAKEIPLAQAREINGLRAVFDEVFFLQENFKQSDFAYSYLWKFFCYCYYFYYCYYYCYYFILVRIFRKPCFSKVFYRSPFC